MVLTPLTVLPTSSAISSTDIPEISSPARTSALPLPLTSFCFGIALISPALSNDKALPLIEFTLLPRASAISSTNEPPFTKSINCVSCCKFLQILPLVQV
jgi:hypothetical protein